MSVELLETRTMLGLVEEKKPFQAFLLSLFFPREAIFDTRKIDLEKIVKDIRRAPFVSPVVQGRVMRKQGSKMLSFEPAYLKPKHVVDFEDVIDRMAGEAIGGSMSNEQRALALKAMYLVAQDESILVRMESMAAEIMRTGKVVISGEDYPTSEVDFGRDAQNTVTLAGASKWDVLAKDSLQPEQDLTLWNARCKSAVTQYTMNANTYALFASFDCIKDKLETRRGSESRLETAAYNGALISFMGTYGQIEVWVYTGTYLDETNDDAEAFFIENGGIIISSQVNDGVQCFGAIADPKAGYKGMRRFPKNWVSEDPAGEYVMTQCAPLPALPDANKQVYAKVY
jgi:hypothetical protein